MFSSGSVSSRLDDAIAPKFIVSLGLKRQEAVRHRIPPNQLVFDFFELNGFWCLHALPPLRDESGGSPGRSSTPVLAFRFAKPFA